MKKSLMLPAGFAFLSLLLVSFYTHPEKRTWKTVDSQNLPEPRNENAFVRLGDYFYLMGGRKKLSVERYDPRSRRWEPVAPIPTEMHHFQAVVHQGEIYVVGAFTGDYPHETPLSHLYIYNPKQDQWREGSEIPEARRRGNAGVVVYKDKIYVISGIIDGHYDGHVTWMDEYNPATDTWKTLPDAPRARDHFHGAIVGDQLVVAGGRRTTAKTGHVVDLLVPEVDVYNFKTNTWKTLPAAQNIPTPRAGCTAAVLGNQVVIIGGESTQKIAHNQTEALDLRTNSWQTLAPLQTGRHATQAVVHGNKVYVAAGTANQGGSPELNSMEVLE